MPGAGKNHGIACCQVVARPHVPESETRHVIFQPQDIRKEVREFLVSGHGRGVHLELAAAENQVPDHLAGIIAVIFIGIDLAGFIKGDHEGTAGRLRLLTPLLSPQIELPGRQGSGWLLGLDAGHRERVVLQEPGNRGVHIVQGDGMVIGVYRLQEMRIFDRLLRRIALVILFTNVPDDAGMVTEAGDDVAVILFAVRGDQRRIILQDQVQDDLALTNIGKHAFPTAQFSDIQAALVIHVKPRKDQPTVSRFFLTVEAAMKVVPSSCGSFLLVGRYISDHEDGMECRDAAVVVFAVGFIVASEHDPEIGLLAADPGLDQVGDSDLNIGTTHFDDAVVHGLSHGRQVSK
jgi:hypothetical protein